MKKEKITKPDAKYLMNRADENKKRGDIDDNVKALSIGADIFPDRIEAHLIGWGLKMNSWSVDYFVLSGDCYNINDPSWNLFEDILRKQYKKINGEIIPLHIALIDCNGKPSETVENLCERFPHTENSISGVYPCSNGVNFGQICESSFNKSINRSLIGLDDQKLKKQIYNNLLNKKPIIGTTNPHGYMHFPTGYDSKFFKQLTAEEISEVQNTKGTHVDIVISNTKKVRNEVLSCTKMAMGGFYYMYLKFFELLNISRANKKKAEIVPSWDYFWATFNETKEENELAVKEDFNDGYENLNDKKIKLQIKKLELENYILQSKVDLLLGAL